MKKKQFLAATFAVLLALQLLVGCAKDERAVVPPESQPVLGEVNWSAAADAGQNALMNEFYNTGANYFNQNNNGHTGFNYWWNAHALDVLVDAYVRTKDVKYKERMTALLQGCYVKNGNTYWNTFYDDMEWWALACLRAYDATGDLTYKTMARQYWTWIKVGWSDIKNGGIAWASGSKDSKNACSNAPAVIIACRLYQLDKQEDDLVWAKKIYTWLKTYVVDGSRGLVWDAHGNKNEDNIYTYNQGTWVGAGMELYRITKDRAYLDDAVRNVNYLINDGSKFSPRGVLKGENTGDGGLFKGIFIRYMAELTASGFLDSYTQMLYLDYLKLNGQSLFHRAVKAPENIFGHDWFSRPASKNADCSVQLSGVILFESLDGLKRLKLLK
ncbi:glycosyl hydrolase family 76 [Pedobacter yulinensis]|uniref:Glycosyl hydrolase family 76 n=1 Tax=Pedobacter yulinensis TaxID=2126353 RepID=A0A2T3HKD6_9SPHI|nr:glycoside hydrolase family 76 protein [Pedobacter yulinensis]PST82890.1 glycosyl hydrolase family 76 [Pedobacter yulinensis]